MPSHNPVLQLAESIKAVAMSHPSASCGEGVGAQTIPCLQLGLLRQVTKPKGFEPTNCKIQHLRSNVPSWPLAGAQRTQLETVTSSAPPQEEGSYSFIMALFVLQNLMIAKANPETNLTCPGDWGR